MVNRRRHDDSDDDDTDSVTSEDFCESFEVAGDRSFLPPVGWPRFKKINYAKFGGEQFNNMPPELKQRIYKEAQGELEPRAHRVTITACVTKDGNKLYSAKTTPPNPVPSIDETARALLCNRPKEGEEVRAGFDIENTVQYACLFPDLGTKEQTEIVFDPDRDTIQFDSRSFPQPMYVYQFLESCTQEQRDKIQKIEFYDIDQSWYDGNEPPSHEVLLLMNNLKEVTYLEDRRGRTEGKDMEGRETRADNFCEDLATDNEGWSAPITQFKLDDSER